MIANIVFDERIYSQQMCRRESKTSFFLRFSSDSIEWVLTNFYPSSRVIPFSLLWSVRFSHQKKLAIAFKYRGGHGERLCEGTLHL